MVVLPNVLPVRVLLATAFLAVGPLGALPATPDSNATPAAIAAAQRAVAASLPDECAGVKAAGPMAVHTLTGSNALSLCEGHVLGQNAALRGAQPLSRQQSAPPGSACTGLP